MSEGKIVFERLIELGKVDAILSRLAAERKTIETELSTKSSEIQKLKKQFEDNKQNYESRKSQTEQIDRRLKDEQAKLVERRKSLATFNNYKLQQAAEREIENTSRQLSEQESTLVAQLDEIEKLGEEVKSAEEKISAQLEEYQKREEEAKEELSGIEERFAEKSSARDEIYQHVDKRLINEYVSVQKRHPNDPIVKVDNGNCSGCYMQIPPQFVVRLGRGQELVRCRGCGRILYMEFGESEES